MQRVPFVEKLKNVPTRMIQLYFVIFLILYLVISIYSIFTVPNLSSNLIYFLIILPFTNLITAVILLGLLLISAFLYYGWMGYNSDLQLDGMNGVLFFVIGVGFILMGVYLFHSAEPTVSSATDQLSFLSDAKFGNAVGLIGLGVAIFSIGIINFDKLQMHKKLDKILWYLQKKEYLIKKYETPLSVVQFNRLGLIWIIAGTIIGFFISLTISILPFLTTLALIVSILWIGVVGLLLMFYAYYKSKKPIPDPEQCSFEELVQRVNDELLMQK